MARWLISGSSAAISPTDSSCSTGDSAWRMVFSAKRSSRSAKASTLPPAAFISATPCPRAWVISVAISARTGRPSLRQAASRRRPDCSTKRAASSTASGSSSAGRQAGSSGRTRIGWVWPRSRILRTSASKSASPLQSPIRSVPTASMIASVSISSAITPRSTPSRTAVSRSRAESSSRRVTAIWPLMAPPHWPPSGTALAAGAVAWRSSISSEAKGFAFSLRFLIPATSP